MTTLIEFALVRVLAVSLVTAVVSAGAVYFVVDQSRRGMETAVSVANSRIDDQTTMLRGIGDSVDRLLVAATDQRVERVERAFAIAQTQRAVSDHLAALASEGRALAEFLAGNEVEPNSAAELQRIADEFNRIAGSVVLMTSQYSPAALNPQQ